MSSMPSTTTVSTSKQKLLNAAIALIRSKGYAATRVEDVCDATGLTKGSFFHHFASKEELAFAAAEQFASNAEAVFSKAPYHERTHALDRLIGYADFRQGAMKGDLAAFTCPLGMMAAGNLQDESAARRSVRPAYRIARRHSRARHRGSKGRTRSRCPLDRTQSCDLHAGCGARRVRRGQVPTGPGGRRGLP